MDKCSMSILQQRELHHLLHQDHVLLAVVLSGLLKQTLQLLVFRLISLLSVQGFSTLLATLASLLLEDASPPRLLLACRLDLRADISALCPTSSAIIATTTPLVIGPFSRNRTPG